MAGHEGSHAGMHRATDSYGEITGDRDYQAMCLLASLVIIAG